VKGPNLVDYHSEGVFLVNTNVQPCPSLLQRIQQVSFAALELNLYLDTHPEDTRALEQYNRLHKELCELKAQFEQQRGEPLLNFGYGANSAKTWRWAETPWPWDL
jgi:spore coat protein JB